MINRNQSLINFVGLVIVCFFAFLVYQGLFSEEEGLTLGSAPIDERVSAGYINKNVSAPASRVQWGTGGYENGAANVVTSIVVDYRMFDTLGEILVLFCSASAVSLLMVPRKKRNFYPASTIVTAAVPIIMVFVLVIGFYIISHGHLTPGGGFPGGAVLASAYILQFLAFRKKGNKVLFKILEAFFGLGIVAMALLGFFLKGSLFANFLPTGVMGESWSAYGIMILYSLIGFKVAAELSALTTDFVGE